MDTAYKSRRVPAKTKPRRVADKRKGETRRDRNRLIQLLVSVILFLVVFAGRGVFSEQIQAWGVLTSTDTDFGTVFRTFAETLTGGGDAFGAFERLSLSLLGAEPEPEPDAEPSQAPVTVTPLSQTGRLGLDLSSQFGVLRDVQTEVVQPSEPVVDEPEPTPEIVTAVAQAYAEDGTALPSNVSFLYYELGLDETVVPVSGNVTSGFGYRTSPISGKREFHLALDIAADEGTAIAAFADGVVEYIGESDEFGLYLKINHANNVSTFYAHCSKLLVRKGDTVTCGQTVALVGSTGNATGAHLHLTILKDNIRLDPAYYVHLS